MLRNSDYSAHFEISEIIYEEIISLALENLKLKNKTYYGLVKSYILNYDKTDTKIRNKLKNIMVLLQKQIKKEGIDKTLKKLDGALDNLNVKKNKDLYLRLYLVCVVYNESDIENYFF